MSIDPVAQTALPSPSVPRGLDDDGHLAAIRRMGPLEGRRAAARELGEVFFTQLIAALRQTLPEGLFPQVPGRDVYESMFDRQLAEELASGDPLGLAAQLGPGTEESGSVAGQQTTPVGSAVGGAPAAGRGVGYGGGGGGAAGLADPRTVAPASPGVGPGRAQDVYATYR